MIVACSDPGADVTDVSLPENPGAAVQTVIDRIPEMMAAYQVDDLAISMVSDQKTLISEGFGTRDGVSMTSETPCGLYSATKFLTSLTLAALVEKEDLSMDWTIGSMMEDAPEAWKPITLAQLFNHSHGIPMVVIQDAFAEIEQDPTKGNRDIIELVRNDPLEFEPGSTSQYRQSGNAVAEYLIEDRLGKNFATLIEEYVTGPAGASQTLNVGYTQRQGEPLIISAGGFQTTAEDMGRIFQSMNSGRPIAPQSLEAFLYEDKYIVDNYSLNSVLGEVANVKTIGHRGGGVRANIRYAPREKLGVMICTEDRSNGGLGLDLADLLMTAALTGEMGPLPFAMLLADVKDLPIEDQISRLQRAVQLGEPGFSVDHAEPQINAYGYALMGQDRLEDAHAVLLLNTQLFPNSANTFDSYGEALIGLGRMEEALKAYKTALSIDPDSANAAKMMAGIEARLAQQ
jgi:CubicO group peptidase (beta-lactamase class C family)